MPRRPLVARSRSAADRPGDDAAFKEALALPAKATGRISRNSAGAHPLGDRQISAGSRGLRQDGQRRFGRGQPELFLLAGQCSAADEQSARRAQPVQRDHQAVSRLRLRQGSAVRAPAHDVRRRRRRARRRDRQIPAGQSRGAKARRSAAHESRGAFQERRFSRMRCRSTPRSSFPGSSPAIARPRRSSAWGGARSRRRISTRRSRPSPPSSAAIPRTSSCPSRCSSAAWHISR